MVVSKAMKNHVLELLLAFLLYSFVLLCIKRKHYSMVRSHFIRRLGY